MSQPDTRAGQDTVIEQSHGKYKIRTEGNSTTVTVPRAFPIETGTEMVVRAGRANRKLIYVKGIPMRRVLNGQAGAKNRVRTEKGVKITEERIGRQTYRVRGGSSPNKSVTIPEKCDTPRFPEKSWPVVVSGKSRAGLAYLKLIPECVHSEAESTAISDLVETVIETSPTC